MLRAVIFDLDDTLYPEQAYIDSGFRAVSRMIAGRLAIEEGAVLDRIKAEFSTSKLGVFDRLLQQLPGGGPTVAETVECYRNHAPTITLDPTIADLLGQLRSQYRLGLVSDGWVQAQGAKVNALGLRQWIECVCLTDQWGRDFWKPHPRGFVHVLSELGVTPQEACYVADNAAKDFLAPRSLGMHSVQLVQSAGLYRDTPAAPAGHPDVVIRGLGDLRTVLTLW